LYHWQTFSAPRHVAAEKLLESLQEFTDSLVEFCQGRRNTRIQFKAPQKLYLKNVVEAGEDFGYQLLEELCKDIEEMRCEDQAIENKRQEFLGAVERAMYLFTLQ
jgi:hypothetical protein